VEGIDLREYAVLTGALRLICGVIGSSICRPSSRRLLGFMLGFILGPLGVLIAAIVNLEGGIGYDDVVGSCRHRTLRSARRMALRYVYNKNLYING
jgi:hypothetical protein